MLLTTSLFELKSVRDAQSSIPKVNNIIVISCLALNIYSFVFLDSINYLRILSLIILSLVSIEWRNFGFSQAASTWNFLTIIYGLLPLTILHILDFSIFNYAGFLPIGSGEIVSSYLDTSISPWFFLILLNVVSRISLSLQFRLSSTKQSIFCCQKINNNLASRKLNTLYFLWAFAWISPIISFLLPFMENILIYKFLITIFNPKTLSLSTACTVSILISTTDSSSIRKKLINLWSFSFFSTCFLMFFEGSKGSLYLLCFAFI